MCLAKTLLKTGKTIQMYDNLKIVKSYWTPPIIVWSFNNLKFVKKSFFPLQNHRHLNSNSSSFRIRKKSHSKYIFYDILEWKIPRSNVTFYKPFSFIIIFCIVNSLESILADRIVFGYYFEEFLWVFREILLWFRADLVRYLNGRIFIDIFGIVESWGILEKKNYFCFPPVKFLSQFSINVSCLFWNIREWRPEAYQFF